MALKTTQMLSPTGADAIPSTLVHPGAARFRLAALIIDHRHRHRRGGAGTHPVAASGAAHHVGRFRR
jgi:hypothetical protein